MRTGAGVFAAVALLAAGCGNSSTPPPQGAGPNVGEPVRLADCKDWQQSDTRQRIGTIHDLRDFAGGPVGNNGLHGNVIDDEDAYRVLQGWCKNSFAASFKLYKLYVRAAAFSGPPQ